MYTVTTKFEKDIQQFFEWVIQKNYKLINFNGDNCEWSNKILNEDFKEPGRNKIEALIKYIYQAYAIYLLDKPIDDAKLMAKDFKNFSKTKKELKTKINVDMLLDTSQTYWLNTLDYNTTDLIKVFGKPNKINDVDEDYVYEWKIKINDDIFSIHDWNNSDKLKNITWNLSSNSNNSKLLIKYIEEQIAPGIKLDFVNL